MVLKIFQQPHLFRLKKNDILILEVKSEGYWQKCSENTKYLKWWVLRFQPIWCALLFFTFSLLLKHLKKRVCMGFNSPACAESKNNLCSRINVSKYINPITVRGDWGVFRTLSNFAAFWDPLKIKYIEVFHDDFSYLSIIY